MSNDLQTNLRYIIMINYDYDSFSHCHLTDIFFRYFRGSKRVKENGESFGESHVRSESC